MPHTFLAVTDPHGRYTEYGLVPLKGMSPIGPGTIAKTGMGTRGRTAEEANPHPRYADGLIQPLTVQQYNALERAIFYSIDNPPPYSVYGGSVSGVQGENCTQWAVRMWRMSGAPEQYGISRMESVGNPYWQYVFLEYHGDVDTLKKMRYYAPNKLLWRWSPQADGCLKLPILAVCVDMQKSPPKLRNPPLAEKKAAVKKVPVDSADRTVESIGKFINWLHTPAPPKPKLAPAATAPHTKNEKSIEPFDLQDIPDVMETFKSPIGAKLLRNWFANQKHGVTSLEEKYSMPGSKFYPKELVDAKTITLDWMMKYSIAEKGFEAFQKRASWDNPTTHAALGDVLSRLPSNAKWIHKNQYTDDRQEMHRDLMFCSLRIDWPMLMKNGDLLDEENDGKNSFLDNDLAASLGGFSLYAAINEAWVSRTATERKMRVDSITFYMMNPYSFYDHTGTSQYLGHWNKKNAHLVPHPPKDETTSHWANFPVYTGNDVYAKKVVMYPIYNHHYRQWQEKHNQGGDMLLFSDFKTISLSSPMEISCRI